LGGSGGRAGRRPAVEHRGLGGEQVEGRRAVRELLAAARRPVRDVWLSESLAESAIIAEICELADAGRVPIRRVPRGRLDAEARTEAPQGVLAHARELQAVDLEALCRGRAGSRQATPFLLAVDGVTDPQNLGALLRTAESAGVTGVVLPRHRTVHITPTVAKAAAGAIEYLPIAIVAGLAGAMVTLAGQGVWTVGLDPSADASLFGLGLGTEAVAVILGGEGAGLSRLVAQRCDVRVAIPQSGVLGSLNVAAAGALAMFEVARRRSH
jgi:23S rRNA (guanosine2251-2'-O)-methyltransferase